MAKLDRTYASAQSDDAFVMVRRGTAVGHRVAIEFRQIGTSAPATWHLIVDGADTGIVLQLGR